MALKKSGITPSDQQAAFFRWVANRPTKRPRKKHAILKARAGCGKTTTGVEALEYSDADRIMYLAFNAGIVRELNARIRNPRAKAISAHAAGKRLVQSAWGREIRVLEGNERARTLTARVVPPDMPKGIQNTISYLHSKGRELAPLATGPDDLIDLMWKFDIHVPEWAEYDWTDEQLADYAYQAMQKAAERPLVVGHGMDFSDMIYLPIKNKLMADLCDELYVDEAQDMSPAQHLLIRGICPNGRIILIGDDRQAIYGWRGAETNGMERVKLELDAQEFPLTKTYRCGKAIVAAANVYVPDLVALEQAPEGIVRDTTVQKMMQEIQPGDFLLSRATQPMVKIAMALLRDGKRARIAGRDMSKGLLRLVDKYGGGDSCTVAEMMEAVRAWRSDQIDRYAESDTPQRAQMAMDMADVLLEIADDCTSVAAVKVKMEAVFTDDGTGADVIMCSTVHKAKGLERKRVYILRDTMQFGRSQEEDNIIYVAITRAKEELVWVTGK